jgi:hypothetical protein
MSRERPVNFGYMGLSESTIKWLKDHEGNDTKTETTPSLDRLYVQLRQDTQDRLNLKIGAIKPRTNLEKKAYDDAGKLKAWLKENGYLFGESLEQTKVYFGDEWPELIESYEKWRNNMERCYIVMKNKNTTDKKGIIKQCQTRFSAKSKKTTRFRMEQFGKKVQKGGNRYGLEVTLTMDPKRFPNLRVVGQEYTFFIEKFMDFANQRLRRAGKKNTTCYLRAFELTESGLLHVHIGFYGAGITGKIKKVYADGKVVTDYIFPQKTVADLWKKYGIGEVAWVMRKPVNEAVDYVTKHVVKSWGGESNLMMEAFLHYTNLRQWSASRGAVPDMPDSVENWEMVNFVTSPSEATRFRDQLIGDDYRIIKDEIVKDILEAVNT